MTNRTLVSQCETGPKNYKISCRYKHEPYRHTFRHSIDSHDSKVYLDVHNKQINNYPSKYKDTKVPTSMSISVELGIYLFSGNLNLYAGFAQR